MDTMYVTQPSDVGMIEQNHSETSLWQFGTRLQINHPHHDRNLSISYIRRGPPSRQRAAHQHVTSRHWPRRKKCSASGGR